MFIDSTNNKHDVLRHLQREVQHIELKIKEINKREFEIDARKTINTLNFSIQQLINSLP